MRTARWGLPLAIAVIALAIAAIFGAVAPSEAQPDGAAPELPCVVAGECLDVTSIPEVCAPEKVQTGTRCTMTLEGDELKMTAAERAEFLNFIREDMRKQRERGFATPASTTGCPPVVEDPKNPPHGCTPPRTDGWRPPGHR